MKIAFIGGRTFRHPDGIATFMYNLATELVGMGHEIIVYQESNHNGEEMVNGFKVVHQKSTKSAIYNKMGLGVKSTFNAIFHVGAHIWQEGCVTTAWIGIYAN